MRHGVARHLQPALAGVVIPQIARHPGRVVAQVQIGVPGLQPRILIRAVKQHGRAIIGEFAPVTRNRSRGSLCASGCPVAWSCSARRSFHPPALVVGQPSQRMAGLALTGHRQIEVLFLGAEDQEPRGGGQDHRPRPRASGQRLPSSSPSGTARRAMAPDRHLHPRPTHARRLRPPAVGQAPPPAPRRPAQRRSRCRAPPAAAASPARPCPRPMSE